MAKMLHSIIPLNFLDFPGFVAKDNPVLNLTSSYLSLYKLLKENSGTKINNLIIKG